MARSPQLLLSRGYSARGLGSKALLPLSSDEVDADLRHMQAYDTACRKYHQQVYTHYNIRALLSTQAVTSLDPELDQRQVQLQQKVAAAEQARQNLEQTYESVTAHVTERMHAFKELQKQGSLLPALKRKARYVAQLRAAVQVCREIHAVYQYRRAHVAAESSVGNDDGGELLHYVNPVEEEEEQPPPNNTNKPTLLYARVEPSTPYGVPLYLSAASTVPEKSAAWLTTENQNWQDGLVWIPGHLPSTLDDDDDDLPALRQQVAALHQEWADEVEQHEATLQKLHQLRPVLSSQTVQLECVRQETESLVLHHNVVVTNHPNEEEDDDEKEEEPSRKKRKV